MQFFSTILLFHTLRGIIAELEQQPEIDSNNPALVQLKYTLTYELACVAESRNTRGSIARLQGTA